jgi:hypothetical protein
MDEKKGEWAEVAEEGIVPAAGPDEHPVTGETTGDDTPATSTGVDETAGDRADATSDGGAPGSDDLKDVTAGPRQLDADSAT